MPPICCLKNTLPLNQSQGAYGFQAGCLGAVLHDFQQSWDCIRTGGNQGVGGQVRQEPVIHPQALNQIRDRLGVGMLAQTQRGALAHRWV